MLILVFQRELLLAMRRPADALSSLLFFILVGSLFPLAIGPDAAILRTVGPGVVWVAAALAVLVSLHRLFEHDLADGSLEQWLLAPRGLIGLAATKVVAHWLITGVPLLLAAPLLALQYGLSSDAALLLALTLLLGTPTLALLGALGAALTLGMRGQVLQALIVLPLSIPPLVFACSAVSAGEHGLPAGPALNLLGACLSLAIFFCPWATAAALRLALE